jgi:hypothetical protein
MKWLLTLLFCTSLNAATFYVDPAGDDNTGTGSSGNPWQSPYHAFPLLSAGDTCIIRDGLYSNPVHDITTGSAAGTAGSPITVWGTNAQITDSCIFVGGSNWTFHHLILSNVYHGAHLIGGFTIDSSANSTAILDCTIKNGYTASNSAAYGVVWYPNPSAMYSNNPQGWVVASNSCAMNCIVSNCVLDTLWGDEYIRVGGMSNLIVNNYLANGVSADVFQGFGAWNTIRGNYVTNFNLVNGVGQHPDMFQTYGQDINVPSQSDPWFDAYNIVCERNQFWDCNISFGQFENGDTNVNPIIKVGWWTFRENLFVRCGSTNGSVSSFGVPGMQWINNTYIFCGTNANASGSPIYLLTHVQPECGFPWHYRGKATNDVIVNNVFIGCGTSTNNGWMTFDNEEPIATNGYWALSMSNNYAVYWDGSAWKKVNPNVQSQQSTVTCFSTNYYTVDTYILPVDINTGADPQIVQLDAHFSGHGRPMNGSPLIDAGAVITGNTNDFEGLSRSYGSAPDIGAYEFDPACVLHYDWNEGFAASQSVTDVTGKGHTMYNMENGTNWMTTTNAQSVQYGKAAQGYTNGTIVGGDSQTYTLGCAGVITNNISTLDHITNGTIRFVVRMATNAERRDRIYDCGYAPVFSANGPVCTNSWSIMYGSADPSWDPTVTNWTLYVWTTGDNGKTNSMVGWWPQLLRDGVTWMDCVVTWSGTSNMLFYANGALTMSNYFPNAELRIDGALSPLWIAFGVYQHEATPVWQPGVSFADTGFQKSTVGDTRIWNRQLTTTEVAALNSGASSASGVVNPTVGRVTIYLGQGATIKIGKGATIKQ